MLLRRLLDCVLWKWLLMAPQTTRHLLHGPVLAGPGYSLAWPPSLEVLRCDVQGCHLEAWTCRMNQRNFNQSSAGTRSRCLRSVIPWQEGGHHNENNWIIQMQSLPVYTSIQHCFSLFLSLHTHQQVFTDPPFIHVGDFSDKTHKSANNGLALWEKSRKQTQIFKATISNGSLWKQKGEHSFPPQSEFSRWNISMKSNKE